MFPKSAALLALSILFAVASASAQTAETLRADYERLQQWRFRTDPIAVPAGGLRWTFEGATWSLESGRIWLQEPTSGGAVTGMVFEGKGRFQMAVPDHSELAQLRRFAKKPDLAGLDETFSSLVLRTSGELPLQGVTIPPANRFEVNRRARDRHDQWLTQRIFDADSRVVAGLASPGDLYQRIDMETDSFGWLTYEYDGWRIEEIRVESFNTRYPMTETWLSLDRPSERDDRGRPGSRWQPALDIRHVDIAADLTTAGRDKDWYKGRFKAGAHVLPQRDGARAAQLYLHPFAKVTAVGEGGKPVPFLRDHVGGRSASLDDRVYDSSLVVLLDPPLARGAERRIDVEYELDLKGYAPGRDWYPDAEGDETILYDTSTARLELKVRKKHQVRAMGRQEEGSAKEDGNTSTSVWIIDQPVKMLTFSFADYFHEEPVTLDGAPEVVAFGSKVQVSGKGKFRAVGEDIAESLAFYQNLFGVKLPEQRIQVTSIDGFHGQAFDGFIHLAENSFDLLGPGAGELFRGHEAAHQFWGVLVGGATYRDAWIGEAFAEYSGMMFVEATMKDGPKHLREVLQASRDELTGSIKSGFSKFSRMQINIQNRAHGERIGPIGHGWRANTGELPWAYSSQVYTKGALVLHMLRGLLRDATGSDQAFSGVLRDFLRTHQGGVASTRDFEAAVARRVPGDWSWFFDGWVNGTAIPTYRWTYTVASAPDGEGNYTATLKVRQTDVPEGFRMSVPVTAELPGGRVERQRVMVDEAEETFTLSYPEKPKSLVFNPEDEVLARTRKD